MAAKKEMEDKSASEKVTETTVTTGVADPAPATVLQDPSGAIVEPQIIDAVDVSHEAIDANPRAGTTARQNAIDLNDAKRANPGDPAFAGQGIDLSVYGTPNTDDPSGHKIEGGASMAADRSATGPDDTARAGASGGKN